jgi:PAS domain S-box-containing protein
LDFKTRELVDALVAMRATLESTADGILVTDAAGTVLDFNQQYLRMWQLEPTLQRGIPHQEVVEHIAAQFADPDAFLAGVAAVWATSQAETFDVLELKDGRVYERLTKPQRVAMGDPGRVWSFRDITGRVQAQRSADEYVRRLEILNRTGTAVASEQDVHTIVQLVTDAGAELTGADFGAFFYNVVDADGEAYRLYTLTGAPREAFEHFPMPRITALFAPTFKGAGRVRCDDVLTHPDYGKSAPYHGMPPGHLPVRSYLAVPVVSRSGQVHGALLFGHADTAKFTAQHEALLVGLTAQAAIAIDNARLFEAAAVARNELEKLNDALEVKVAERTEALRKSELQFQQLVAGVTDCAIYMLDPNGYVTSWNPGAERIKGYTAQEIIGRHFSEFYTPEDRAIGKPAQALAIATRDGKFEAEAWRVRKDGTRFWASVLLDAIRHSSGTLIGFAKITRDMTERRVMQEQLNQSQKMEAIGQLTGGVAHDFNNLLTVILGNLETVWQQVPEKDGRVRRAVDQARRGAQRAAALTQQLLAFSRRQPLNPKPTDVNRLVAGISDLIRRTLGENVVVETVLAGGLWSVAVDPHQLESALLNLAVNARDAMPAGGKLTIETGNAHLDDAYVTRYVEIAAGQYVVICVTDTGTGMTRDVMERAFDPFFTTKPLGEGTGLGLSQVFGFVKQTGGHVKLYSEVGQGTTVKIYLPRARGLAPVQQPEPVVAIPQGSESETILVVEDEEDVRLYSTESLRELGFTVLEAHDGTSALRVLEQHPKINLLFTDVGLPGINGRELVDQVRRRWPHLKVLFTTGYARNAIVHQGKLDPGIELLTKPFTRAQLAQRVRQVLDAAPAQLGTCALIVEDEALIRLFLADELSDLGFTVVEAASTEEALAVLERNTQIAVAFVDIGLPDRSGLELAAECRERWPGTRIALASGYGEPPRGRFKSDPHVTFLSKPFDTAGIRSALNTLGVPLKQG